MTTENELDYPIILAAVNDSELGQLTLANAIHQAHEDGAVLIIASIFEKDQLNVLDALSKERTTDARADVENALKRYRQVRLVDNKDTMIQVILLLSNRTMLDLLVVRTCKPQVLLVV